MGVTKQESIGFYKMSKLLTIQEPFIIWLQSNFHPQADNFFKFFTDVGGMQWSFFIWGFFIWSVSYSFGCRLVLVWLFGSYLSLALKGIIATPRPIQASSQVIPIITEKGSGFPSGHAMSATITWGYFALFEKRKWITLLALLMIFWVSLSRVYLGVHYPMDVMGSWAIGGLLLWACICIAPAVEKFLDPEGIINKLIIILVGAAVIFTIISRFAPSKTALLWYKSSFTFYLSFTLGWLLQGRFIKFKTQGKWLRKTLRFLIGGTALFCLMHFSRKGFLFYSATGLWLTLGAPALFRALKL